MYNNCGALEDALALFSNTHGYHSPSWNFIIREYARQGRPQEALHLFHQMQREAVLPDKFTFVHMISACSRQTNTRDGKQLHARIRVTGFEQDVMVGTALVNMYGKYGSFKDAHNMLKDMPERNVVSWTAMIAVSAQQGQHKEALEYFELMQQEGIKPNRVTFVCILDVYAGQVALASGNQMHACIADCGFEFYVSVGNALINMYRRCGSPGDACRVFKRMTERNLISWNSMLTVYVQHVQVNEAFQHFAQMWQEGLMPNNVTFICILDLCTSQSEANRMHTWILESEFESNLMVGTALINTYGRCGSLMDAERLFEKLPHCDVVLWTSMIALYGQYGRGKEAIRLFDQMQQEGIEPNMITSVCILDACSSSAALAEGRLMHAGMLDKGFDADIIAGNALVRMYARCCSLVDAQNMFDKMPERNVISWTAMIAVYTHQHGHANGALLLFKKMQENGIQPNEVTFAGILEVCASQAQLGVGKYIHACMLDSGFEVHDILASVLVKMYGKCGSLEDGRVVFDSMPKGSVVLWTAIIGVHAQQGECNQALQLFYRMHKEGIEPNMITFICVLDACSGSAVLAEGEQLHLDIICSGLEQDVSVGTALVNMYGKCGNLQAAQGIFDKLSDQNVVLWTAMISVYAQHGQGKGALWLLKRMQQNGVMPNNVTVMSILDACSHAGLVNEGGHAFAWAILYSDSSLDVDHYVCMIDLLGRAGRLDEAEYLISNMPLQPTVVLFTALLGACRYQNDVERAELAAKYLLELDPENTAAYVTLSNLYALACHRGGDVPDGVSVAMVEDLISIQVMV